MAKPIPPFPDFAPTAQSLRREAVERAIRETTDNLLENVIQICDDIAGFNGSATDCAVALRVFHERLIAARTNGGSKQ